MERIVLIEWVTHRETTKRYRPGITGTLESVHKDACDRLCARVTLDDKSEHVLFFNEYRIIPEEKPCQSL